MLTEGHRQLPSVPMSLYKDIPTTRFPNGLKEPHRYSDMLVCRCCCGNDRTFWQLYRCVHSFAIC